MKQENRLKIDSIRKVLPSLHDSARVDCLNALFLPYKRLGLNDSAIYTVTQAYTEATSINYIGGIAESLTNKAAIENLFNGNFPACEQLARDALRWYDKTPNKRGIAWAYYNLGCALFEQRIFSEANENFELSYNWYQKTGNRQGMFSTLISWACNYEISGDYEKAFDYKRQALRLAYTANNDLWIRDGSMFVAESFRQIADYSSAINYYRQGFQKTDPDERDAMIYMDFAILFVGQNQFDSAFYYLNLVDTSKVNEAVLQNYHMVKGEFYLWKKEYDKALPYFLNALKYYTHHNDRARAARMVLDIANTYLRLQNNDSALSYARKCLVLARQANSRELTSLGLFSLYAAFDQRKQTDSANFYFRQYNIVNDSLLNDRLKGKLASYGPEQKIELLNNEKEIQQVKLQKQAILKNILIAGIVVLLLIGVLIFRYIMLKRKNEKLESESAKSELQQRATHLEIQALRAQMNPHFIFNCLSSINRFILKNESEPASNYLTKFSRLIRMVLNNYKESFITLDDELEMLRLYLEMERLRFRYAFDYNISFKNEIDPENIFIPPLLFQPFAENAIWHGFMHKQGQGHLEIELSLSGKILTCIITDNGIGRTKAAVIKSKSTEKQKSMGLQITTERLSLLNHDSIENTFFTIRDLTGDDGEPAGTQVILKIHYRDLMETRVEV